MTDSAQALIWGWFAASALALGAAIGCSVRIPQRLVAATMAFGSGFLISTLSIELMEEAFRSGGYDSPAIGFVCGTSAYTLANLVLARYGAKHRKRSTHAPDSRQKADKRGIAIAVGSLLDGIPESIAIGVSVISGHVSTAMIAAVFLSNFPEGLSSATGMKTAGRSRFYILCVWLAIATACGISSWIGFALFTHCSGEALAVVNAMAAGAILAMVADTMIPEAFETAHDFTGLITCSGFLASYILSKLA